MDDLQKELFRAIFAGFAGESTDEAALQMAVQLAFVGRDYERAADHAVMIGRWVEFMVTGELPGDVDPDSRAPDASASRLTSPIVRRRFTSRSRRRALRVIRRSYAPSRRHRVPSPPKGDPP